MSKGTVKNKKGLPAIDIDTYTPRGADVIVQLPNPNASGLHIDEKLKHEIAFTKRAYHPIVAVGPEQKRYHKGTAVFLYPAQVMAYAQQGGAYEIPTQDNEHLYIQIPEVLIVGTSTEFKREN